MVAEDGKVRPWSVQDVARISEMAEAHLVDIDSDIAEDLVQ
jgi:hypothetical protein